MRPGQRFRLKAASDRLWLSAIAGCLMLVVGVPNLKSAPYFQDKDQTYTVPVIRRVAPKFDVPPDVAIEFDRFFAAYSEQLRKSLHAANGVRWEYSVTLAPQSGRKNRLRIVVTGSGGPVRVHIGSCSPRGALRSVPGLVKRSVALWRDPILGAMVGGDAAALETILPGSLRK